MASEALMRYADGEHHMLAGAALTSGEVLQLADGRAAVYAGLAAAAAGDAVCLYTKGTFELTKATGFVAVKGCKAYWDRSAGSLTYAPTSDSFCVGVFAEDAASTVLTVDVELNVEPRCKIKLGEGLWTAEATEGLGVTQAVVGTKELKLAFDNAAEVAQAAYFSTATVDAADGPILMAKVAVFDVGDNSALDINFGLASASHATDLGAVTSLVTAHLAGNSLNINVQSDNGSTDVAPVDSTISAVDDTYFWLCIDCRNPADVQVYVNGADAVPAGTTLVMTGASALKAIVHMEKTSNDTTAEIRVAELTVQTSD